MKKLVVLTLVLALILPCFGCSAAPEESFAKYVTEQENYLKSQMPGDATSDEMLLLWNAQERLHQLSYNGNLGMDENKKLVDAIISETLQELAYCRATIDDYVVSGLFKEDYIVTLQMDGNSEGLTGDTLLVFDLLVSDGSIKSKLKKSEKISDLFAYSNLFFMKDGSFTVENKYTQLMVDAKKCFSSGSDEQLASEVITGTYTVNTTAGENGLYEITAARSDGGTITFWLNPKGGAITGKQLYNHEIYERTGEITVPQKTIQAYLNEAGYLKKNSMESPKADYYVDLSGEVQWTEALKTAISAIQDENLKNALNKVSHPSDIYLESVVTFLESGEAVVTDHFTALGVQLMAAQGIIVSEGEAYVRTGSYTVDMTAKADSTLHGITVSTKDEQGIQFIIDTADGRIQRQDLFESEYLIAFTLDEVLAASGGGYKGPEWTEADGTVIKDVQYGSEARNLLDVYIPANFDPNQQNGVLLFIHGGAWTSGNKEDVETLCKQYAKQGYFTATMNHSYAASSRSNGGKTTLLDINQEVGLAMAKLKALSDENGWNLTQSALYGYSSGCHIALLYAYSDGNEASAPLPVKTVFGMVGCVDFRDEYWANIEMNGPGIAAVGLNDERLVSTTNPYPEDVYNELIDSISPIAFAKRGDAVPTVAAYAMLDPALIDWYNGVALEQVMEDKGIANEIYLLPNSGHVTGNNPLMTRQFFQAMDSYLTEYFGY